MFKVVINSDTVAFSVLCVCVTVVLIVFAALRVDLSTRDPSLSCLQSQVPVLVEDDGDWATYQCVEEK